MADKKITREERAARRNPADTNPQSSRHVPAEKPLRYKPLVASLVMIVAICVLYPELAFQNKIFFSGDNQAAASCAAALKQPLDIKTAYPLWNPYLFSGMPSFGSLSYTAYVYPVNAIIGVLVKYLHFTGYLWLLFHTFMAGLGTYLVLRDRGVWFVPSVTAGVLMMWMPNLVAVGAYGHGSQACAVGYIPFALLFWDRLWRGKGTVANGCALVIVFGLTMLRGHLQIAYYTYMLVGLHILFFGAAKILDGIKRRVPATTVLPRSWFARLTNQGKKYSVEAALAEWGWAAAVLAVVVVASILVSAVLYLPVHDYAQYSIRGASASGGLDYEYATGWSLHPAEMLTFIVPFSFGFGKDLYFGHMLWTDYPNYVGLIVVVLSFFALVKCRNRYTAFLFFVVLIATLISFGKYFNYVYNLLFEHLPYFNKFRVPVMILILQQFAFAVLFGVGLDRMMRADPARGRSNTVKALAVAFLIFMIIILSQNFWPGEFADAISKKFTNVRTAQEQVQVARVVGNFLFKDLVRLSVVLAAAFALLFLYFDKKLPQLVFGGLFLVVTAADFYIINQKILHPEEFRKHEQLRLIHDRSVLEAYKAPDDLISFLKQDERFFRIFPMDRPQRPFGAMFQSNRFMNFGISSIGGYHPAKLVIYQEFFNALHMSLVGGRFHLPDMLNVRYVVAGAELPDIERFREVWRGVDYLNQPRFVYENLPALPRAWLVDSYHVADDAQTSDLLAAGRVDPATSVILARRPTLDPEPVEGSPGEVTIDGYGYNEIQLTARNETPAILVLSEVYYPDWKVHVDGAPAEMLRANYILRAVALPAGEHKVVFKYDASLLKRGLVVSATVLGGAILLLVGALVFGRKGRLAWKHS